MRHTSVLLDRFPLWLDAVEAAVTGVGIKVIGRAQEADEALALIQTRQPDLHVVGTHVFGVQADVLTYLEKARERAANVSIIVLSSDAEPVHIAGALQAGAYVYVLDTAEPDDLAAAIRQGFEHTMYLPELDLAPSLAASGGATSPLTPRETGILRLVAQGRSNAQVAGMLRVTEQTVKFHLSNIYRKLEISNRTEASRWAHTHRLLSSRAGTSAMA